MKTILIAKGVRPLRNGKRSAKEYPFWNDLVPMLKNEGYEVKEIVEMPLQDLEALIKESLTVVCCDSFVQHFCWSINKPAVVLWGTGDPAIFGHRENINLLKSRNNLRPNQFDTWEEAVGSVLVWVSPKEVLKTIKDQFPCN